MIPRPAVRLPLQIGSSSLFNLAIGAGALLPGLLAPIWWSALLFVAGPLGYLFGFFVPFFLTGLALAALRKAIRRRASDLVIEPSGVRIDGGRLHGLAFEIKELRAESWRVQSRGQLAVLEIDLPGTSEMVLAETTDTRERQAFDDVVQTIRATFTGAPASDTTVSPHLIRCMNCGAEATPDVRHSVPCRYCGNPVAMPADVRAKLQQGAQRKKELARSAVLLEQLLRQPSVASTNRLLSLVGASMLVVWPASIATCVGLLHAGRFSESGIYLLLVLPLPLILGLFLAAAWRLVDRQALQIVTLGLGAEPPRREGEPHHCRACGGPLPAPGNEVLVECLFCSVENVFGLDLRHALGKAMRQVKSLEQAMRERRARRLAWGGPAAFGMLLALGAGYGLVQTARAELVPSALSVCSRTVSHSDLFRGERYNCGHSLERNDRVSGRDVVTLLGEQPGWRFVVRKVPPGADPEVGNEGVDLVEHEDYAAFVVRNDGFAYLYVDRDYAPMDIPLPTKPAATAPGGGSE